MWWDGSSKATGEVINVTLNIRADVCLLHVFGRAGVGNISGNNTGAQSITGILDQLGGAGATALLSAAAGGGAEHKAV